MAVKPKKRTAPAKKQKRRSVRTFDYEIGSARTTEHCFEIATVDCYDENEAANGWLCCFEEVFSDVQAVKFMGEAVTLKQFDLDGDTVVAAIEKTGKKAKVSLDSIKLIKPTKPQALWLRAYLEHGGG